VKWDKKEACASMMSTTKQVETMLHKSGRTRLTGKTLGLWQNGEADYAKIKTQAFKVKKSLISLENDVRILKENLS